MTLRIAMAAVLLSFQPAAAMANSSDICRSLERRLATLPQVIGSTADVRRHAEELRYHHDEVRYLRTQMRRARCGAGSIVTFGQRDDICGEMARALRETEAARDRVLAQRSAARQILQPNGERNAIVAALDANGCTDDHVPRPRPVAAEPQLDPESGSLRNSSITTLPVPPQPAPAERAEAQPPPPERPYDPSRRVRSVGPVFLPDDTPIDLANPRGADGQSRR